MADYINNVAALDGYTNALTLGPNYQAKQLVVTVANNPALMQFAQGKPGNWRWTDEREFFSIPQSFAVGNVIGAKFRNANAGQVARILATLSGDDDPQFGAGLPFTSTLNAQGQVAGVNAVLAYNEDTTAVINFINGTVTLITASAVTCDGVTPIKITYNTPFVTYAGTLVTYRLFQDGIDIGELTGLISSASSMDGPLRLERRFLPTSGSHTYSIRAVSTGAAGSDQAGAGGLNVLFPRSILIEASA